MSHWKLVALESLPIEDLQDLSAGVGPIGLNQTYDTSERNCPWWDIVTPEIKHCRKSGNFERNKQSSGKTLDTIKLRDFRDPYS